MPIRVRESADPLSARALDSISSVINAQSEAGRILRYELGRYCDGQIQGRSFLIAGHRGAGKTTMVADALGRMSWDSRERKMLMRPLPVLLHGPSLFETLPSDLRSDGLLTKDANGAQHKGVDESAGKASRETDAASGQPARGKRVPGAVPTAGAGESASAMGAADQGADVRADDASGIESMDIERASAEEQQAQLALVHIILGLQRAVVREYAAAYRRKLQNAAAAVTESQRAELSELAAQFEVELMEDPPASRLREFWSYADALGAGILFDAKKSDAQGSRELVALNGICNAHQRISGALSQRDESKREDERQTTSTSGFDARAIDAMKPLGAVLAGSAVAAGAAAGASSNLFESAVFGLLTAFIASAFLKSTVATTSKRRRQLDRVFIPDLTLRTLDRVLPTLLDRLRDAGLAPVLVIDELDKVTGLSDRIVSMIHHLKKLMAENVFSCFLTDRGYLEYLRIDGRKRAYGQTYSYFSQPLLVAYSPADIDAYLGELLYVPDDPLESASTAGLSPALADKLDCELLKWVLRHRSQLHALALSREIAAIRGEGGELQIPRGAVRTDYAYRIDVTLQMAIDLQLLSPEVAGWSLRQPGMRQTLFDALYFLSRSWLAGEETVETTAKGRRDFENYLRERMNLNEVCTCSDSPVLGPDDLGLLTNALESMVRFLSETNTPDQVVKMWRDLADSREGGPVLMPPQEVMDALLLGVDSLLVASSAGRRSDAVAGREANRSGRNRAGKFRWRYWRSGLSRDPRDARLRDSRPQRQLAAESIAYIQAVENNLWKVFKRPSDPAAPNGVVYRILGDSGRVLKTTPAWSHVQAAINNLALIEKGQGSVRSIEDNCRAVEEFARMLKGSAPALQLVLASAAFLAGMSQAASQPSLDLRESLTILSAGLGFAKLDPDGVHAKIRAFRAALQEEIGTQGHITQGHIQSMDDAADLVSDALAQRVAEARLQGRRCNIDWSAVAGSAWEALFQRLLVLAQTGEQPGAALSEILCAIRRFGPARFLGIDVGRLSLHAWTTALLRAIAPPAGTDTQADEAVPLWLAVFALRQLGAGNLASASCERLLQSVGALAKASEGALQKMHSVASQIGLLRGGESNKVILVVRKSDSSLTSAWTKAPTLGLVMVVNDSRMMPESAVMQLTNAAAQALIIAWEQPPDSPLEQEKTQERIWASSEMNLAYLFVYAMPTSAMKNPSVVEPSGPDALFGYTPLNRAR